VAAATPEEAANLSREILSKRYTLFRREVVR
jgi:hypothetical protein